MKDLARRQCSFSPHFALSCLQTVLCHHRRVYFPLSFSTILSVHLQSLHFSWGLSDYLCPALSHSDYLFIYSAHIWVSVWCPHWRQGHHVTCDTVLVPLSQEAEDLAVSAQHAMGALTKDASVIPMTPISSLSFIFPSSLVAYGLLCHFTPRVPWVFIRHLPFELRYIHGVVASPK